MADPLDTNRTIASLLRDLATVQAAAQSRWGYKRAASAVLNLDDPIEHYLQRDGTLRKIPNVGPSSTRVILEVLRTGRSATVEQSIADSGRAPEVEKARGLRDNFLSRAQVTAALRDRKLRGPTPQQYRGDFQMHSTWSDGTDTLDTLVEGCLARGYTHCAVTDHSYGLPIARGVSMSDLQRQHAEIDRINQRLAGRFRIIKGIEANIRADGSVDMTEAELAALELVVAAPHSALRTTTDQTARMEGAVRQKGVHILGHPRGRMLSARPGVSADWDVVFAAAAQCGVAIEIDGDPSRQDIDFALARQAVKAGCLFALDSDAHSSAQLAYADTAIAHARLAGVPASRVINTWPLPKLLKWLGRR